MVLKPNPLLFPIDYLADDPNQHYNLRSKILKGSRRSYIQYYILHILDLHAANGWDALVSASHDSVSWGLYASQALISLGFLNCTSVQMPNTLTVVRNPINRLHSWSGMLRTNKTYFLPLVPQESPSPFSRALRTSGSFISGIYYKVVCSLGCVPGSSWFWRHIHKAKQSYYLLLQKSSDPVSKQLVERMGKHIRTTD